LGPAPAGFAQAGLAEAPAAGASAVPALVVRTRSAEHTLHGGSTYRIGRDPKSDIVVEDSRVSWQHGALRVDGDGWLLEDVGSTNGTFVGLQRIDRVPIVADCVVRLGNPDDGPVLRCMPEAPAPAPPGAGARRGSPAAPFQAVAPFEAVAPLDAAPPFEPAAPPRQAPPPQAPPPQAPPRQASPPQAPRREAVAGPVPRELKPSVDIRPTSRMRLPAKAALRIGRIPDNDLVLPDLDVSRHHAELRKSPTGNYEIVDLGSHNGTYVNGRRVSSAVIGEDDIVSIGRSTFRLAEGELRQFVDDGEVTFSAQDLVVKVGGGKVLLNRVTFPASSAPAARVSRPCSAR